MLGRIGRIAAQSWFGGLQASLNSESRLYRALGTSAGHSNEESRELDEKKALEWSFNKRIARLCHEGRIDEVEPLWKEMRELHVEPSVHTVTPMLNILVEKGEVEKADLI